MTNFRRLGIAIVMAVSPMLPAPAAMAEHEPAAPPPPPAAESQWADGFYYMVDFSIGDTKNPDTSENFGVDADWSLGLGLGAGYRLGPVRLEAEYISDFFRVGSLDLEPGNPFAPGTYAGGIKARGAMGNLYIDLPAAGMMRPYFGFGYGFVDVSVNYNESVCIIFCFSTQNVVVDDWDRARAGQIMAGLSFQSEGSNNEWFVGYRYFETDDLKLRTTPLAFSVNFTQDGLQSHTINFGFRLPI